MRASRLLVAVALALALVSGAGAREPAGGGAWEPDRSVPCLSDAERARIHAEIDRNVAELRATGVLPAEPRGGVVRFDWPLAPGSGLSDPGYHGISNFVDQNPSYPDALTDYACGARTYDLASGYNHQGIDFFTWPFGWLKMDRGDVEIVAAAPGTIVSKQDGNDDRSCSFGGTWNAVYVQHADGSVAWYGHMKKGSTTAKAIGASVVAGERLGVVGSSGSSTGPHLHLEVYDRFDGLVEPYAGPCNALNAASWWSAQRPYHDSAINRIATQSGPPDFGTCPEPETPNALDDFEPGALGTFVAYYRDQLQGQQSLFELRRPDGSLYTSWTHSSGVPHYNASYWYWTRFLPSDPTTFGTWSFEVTFEGVTYVHPFRLGSIFVDGFESGDAARWSSTAP